MNFFYAQNSVIFFVSSFRFNEKKESIACIDPGAINDLSAVVVSSLSSAYEREIYSMRAK